MKLRLFVTTITNTSQRIARRGVPAVAAGMVTAGLLASSLGPALAGQRVAALGSRGLNIVNSQLYKDGKPYVPRGFNSIGLLTPEWCDRKEGIAARNAFGQNTMDIAKAWNANTMRFQMSQRGLADTSLTAEQRAAYLQRIQDGVALARANGFTVILSMQEQYYGCGTLNPLPSAQTVDAWSIVADAFKGDPYIMFELFNEPDVENDAAGWAQWQNGGSAPVANNGNEAVGHQQLVNQLRFQGVSNVLIADGARKAARLSGLPLLDDPAGQLMYGIHPYYFTPGETWWQEQYGYLSGTVPLIATEWNYKATGCGGTAEQLAPSLLQYLHDRNIGVLGHAIDTPGSTVADLAGTPTECGSATGGSGKVLQNFFLAQTDPDVVPPSAPAHLAAVATAYNQVNLTWDASPENDVAGYQVVRDGTVLASVTGTGYTDATVTAETTYSYTVRAIDTADNLSADAAVVAVTTPEAPDTTAPTAPAQLQATTVTHAQVTLSWQPSTDNKSVTGYTVLRNGVAVAQTAGTGYTDATVTPQTAYLYSVTASDAAGNQSEAATVAVTTPEAPDTTPPTMPGNLRVYIASPTSVQLSWNASSDNKGVTGYRVVRDGITTLATTAALTYTDTSMVTGRSHTYKVAALDAAGNASPEASIGVNVPAPAASGLTGVYFDTATFTSQKLSRVDSTINFAWGTGSPSSKIGADTFSVRWTGKIIPVANETYTFYTQSDDGVRLWVNGQQIINNWTSHTLTENSATITLNANQAYDIKVEYYENKNSATMKLLWSSPSIAKQVVPADRLLAQ